jgi:DNA-directed RNA polymerase subunit F
MGTDTINKPVSTAFQYKDISAAFENLADEKHHITKELRKYLIGKAGILKRDSRCDNESIRNVFEEVGGIFGYARNSVEKLVYYAEAIERIQKLVPDVVAEILGGRTRLTTDDTLILSKMSLTEINSVMARMIAEKTPAKLIIIEEKSFRKKPETRDRYPKTSNERSASSVKDMPLYNPDVYADGLSYTIPSWVTMIEKAFSISNFYEVSPEARDRLVTELGKLTSTAETMAVLIAGVE